MLWLTPPSHSIIFTPFRSILFHTLSASNKEKWLNLPENFTKPDGKVVDIMGNRRKPIEKSGSRPASTPEARENQMISLAVDLAEKQLREGTASNQVIVHYLRLGSKKARLEQEMLSKKTELIAAQAESVKSAQRVEELYSEALAAMRLYSGSASEEDSYDEY